jgi:nucleoid DNA-binding protein
LLLVSEPEFTGLEKKFQNSLDTHNYHKKRAEDIVNAHFEQTEKVLSNLKATQLVVIQDLDSVKRKLEEGKMPATLLDNYKHRVERLTQINELQVSKIDKVESSQLDFCEICEVKSTELLDRNNKELSEDEQHAQPEQR